MHKIYVFEKMLPIELLLGKLSNTYNQFISTTTIYSFRISVVEVKEFEKIIILMAYNIPIRDLLWFEKIFQLRLNESIRNMRI